jgi:ATP-dependent protease ClpP protease subunit
MVIRKATNKRKTPATKLEQILTDTHSYGINPFTREMFLHGFYGDDNEEPGVEYRMATAFEKNIRTLDQENQNNILVHMHTIGGFWNDGMGIFNAIEFTRSPITIVAYAHARSMSSIILQAATNRVMMPDADFMIHFGYEGNEDHYLAFISGAEASKKAAIRMLRIYAKRCINGQHFRMRYKTLTEEKVMNFLQKKMQEKGDWWLDAEQAVYYGFADGVMGQPGYENFDKIRTKKKLILER